MLDQFFINVGHLGKFSSQNIKMHVYEHRQAADRRDDDRAESDRGTAEQTGPRQVLPL